MSSFTGAKYGRIDIVEALLKYNADLNIQDNYEISRIPPKN